MKYIQRLFSFQFPRCFFTQSQDDLCFWLGAFLTEKRVWARGNHQYHIINDWANIQRFHWRVYWELVGVHMTLKAANGWCGKFEFAIASKDEVNTMKQEEGSECIS